MHIDLRPLAQFAGARLIQSEVTEINLNDRCIKLSNRPDIPFDCLSLNIGSRPDSALITGATDHALAVKPIDSFLGEWESIKQQASTAMAAGRDYRLAIVGGGPPVWNWLSPRKLRLIRPKVETNKPPDDCRSARQRS